MKRFFVFIICLLAIYGSVLAIGPDKFVVVIDPGHGGRDGGAVRGIYREKDINLAVGLLLGELIEQNFKDVKVVYTRKKDVFVDLDKRAQIANKAKANLFISIHTNSTAAKTSTVTGADTYILGLTRSAENLEVAKRENSVILLEDDYTTKYEGFDPNSPESYIIFEFMSNKYMEQSLQFAGYIQNDFKSVAKRTDRGVRQAGFLVLRKTSMPSVLIELGFINNPVEAKFLTSRLGQRSMATAIYTGFKRYKYAFDRKQGKFTYNDVGQKENEVIIEEDIVEKPVAEKKTEKPVTTNTISANSSKQSNNTKLETTPKTPTTKTQNKNIKNQIEYRVQFLVSDKALSDKSPLFKGLSSVSYYRDGKSYKYTFGSTTDVNQIVKIQGQVRKDFKDAFIVKFKNGERVK